MLTGLPFRSELLRTLETAARSGGPVSADAVELASGIIEATERALRENAAPGEGRAATPATACAPAAAAIRNEAAANWNGASDVKEKSVGDYVTALDLSLDRHLTRALATVRHLPIVSEEGPPPADIHAIPAAWLIDPLDGTTASLCGETALCGPMVALLEHGEPCMSVMLALDGSTLGIAERGRGASLIRSGQDGTRWLSTGSFEAAGTLKEGCLLFNPQSDCGRSHPAFVRLHDALRTGAHTMAIESRMPHSMAALALGTKRRLAVIHDNSEAFPKQMAWDVLPVRLWVEERGGVYWGIDGSPYDVRRPMPIIAATRSEIAEQLVSLARG